MLPRLLTTLFANSVIIFKETMKTEKKNITYRYKRNEKMVKCVRMYEERVRTLRSTSGSTWPGLATLLTMECDHTSMLLHGSNGIMPIGHLVTLYRSSGLSSSPRPTTWRVLLATHTRKEVLLTQVEPESVLTFGVDGGGLAPVAVLFFSFAKKK